ncbi:hypothetical protein COY07_05655 [Candidatus Peregrinibacteria bacterium CG_4_10_14_0_2_um_filter_43_11]|nr:MAG: hypothetical protein COY07_05655 [Candidatus Peregrinibacteria bacterium CG_4_10_14_0_2_um_filter_43_11]
MFNVVLNLLAVTGGCSLPTGRQARPKGAPLGPALGPLALLFLKTPFFHSFSDPSPMDYEFYS